MKILVTGGTGMVGKNLQKFFNDNKLEGTFVGRGSKGQFDLLDVYKTNNLFSYFKPDVVIHAAATVGGIGFNKNNPGIICKDNLQMGINVLDACVKFNVKNLYITSTCCSYPKFCPVPFKEDDMFDFGGKEELSNRPYGFAKKSIIVLSQAYKEQYGLKSTSFILANLYGPHDHFHDLKNSHVVPALIEKFVNAKEQNLNEVYCWGEGSATRDLFYCEDLAEILTNVIQAEFNYDEPINLGTGNEISIKDLAYLLKELTEFNGDIVFTGEVSDGQPRRCLNVSRAKELLNWEAKTELKEGLIKTINWFQENKENIK